MDPKKDDVPDLEIDEIDDEDLLPEELVPDINDEDALLEEFGL